MSAENFRLCPRSLAVLEMIAAGSSYEQILSAYPDFTYLDIFDSAREALDLSVSDGNSNKPAYRVADVRANHPRAYQRWSDEEDHQLRQLVHEGKTVVQMANRLERQRSAIRSRITKLNLVGELSPHEQSELHRISALDPKEPDDDGAPGGSGPT